MWFCWEHICGVDDKQVICNNLQNHFWSDLQFALLVSDDQVYATVDHLFSWSTLLEVSEQTARQSRSLRQMLSTNKFSTRKWSLWNDTTKLNNWSCVSSILRLSGWSAKSLYKEKTQVRICWIYRSHRGQGWLDTHIRLGLFLSYWALD
jgi:hypothetical protein